MTTLHIIRGLPGSGKSTYAEKLKEEMNIKNHFEADMYFLDKDGNYNFIPKIVYKAHKWCIAEVEKTIQNSEDVIVANTFTKQSEINQYTNLMKKYPELKVVIYEMQTQFETIHDVPDYAFENMKNRWFEIPEDFYDVEIIKVGGTND